MSRGAMPKLPTGKLMVGVLAAGAILLVVAANWHLVHVAVQSQPECVAHVRLGEAASGGQRFGAASSACRPEPTADGHR